jgi:hypothetical protein
MGNEHGQGHGQGYGHRHGHGHRYGHRHRAWIKTSEFSVTPALKSTPDSISLLCPAKPPAGPAQYLVLYCSCLLNTGTVRWPKKTELDFLWNVTTVVPLSGIRLQRTVYTLQQQGQSNYLNSSRQSRCKHCEDAETKKLLTGSCPVKKKDPARKNFATIPIVGAVDEQVARQRLGQHWFITVYRAVCIQGLYTVYNGAGVRSTVAVLGLATNQRRRQPPQSLVLTPLNSR